MANYFRQFAFSMRLANQEQVDWIRSEINKLKNEDDPDSGGDMADFDYKIMTKEEHGSKHHAEIQFTDTGESGNLEHIAKLVQAFLKKFAPRSCFEMSWADTCDKARDDGFGGSSAIVTAKKTFWLYDAEKKWAKDIKKSLRSLAAHE